MDGQHANHGADRTDDGGRNLVDAVSEKARSAMNRAGAKARKIVSAAGNVFRSDDRNDPGTRK
ncbi:MAG: hypothetical protein EA398_07705 [Deltaproteobacteria bacterium]|nr:MAG: hypothetical protein EA398_07705 [Deltaproteobacteria bacterium]